MDYIPIVLSSVTLVVVIILVFLILRRNSKNRENRDSIESIGAVKQKIDSLDNEMSKTFKLVVNEEIEKLSTKMHNNSEENNAKLERFQTNITQTLQTRFDAMNKQMDEKLKDMNKKVDDKLSEGFKNTSETMASVRERLQAIDDAQKNIEGLGKEVISLKNVLEGNQTRGQYGEYQLEMVLNNVFGDTIGCYELQHTMKKVRDGDDVRADAVVFMPEPNKKIAIDSKFPFQDYARMLDSDSDEEKETFKKDFAVAVKKHITTIKDKYIVEGQTAPEALMFIPNDGVFAFIHHELPDVVSYAREKKVVLTSPSTLPAILVTINMVRIEVERAKNAQEISKQLTKLGKDFSGFAKEWGTLSSRIELTMKAREQLDKRVDRINNKFESLSEVKQLDEDTDNSDMSDEINELLEK